MVKHSSRVKSKHKTIRHKVRHKTKHKTAKKVRTAGVKLSIRKDFEIFSQGVQRLEELRKELDAIHVVGHDLEIAAIRAKLKNVSEIPIIEAMIKRLRAKISGKYKHKPKKSRGDELKKLREEVSKKLNFCQTDAKYVKEIPELKEELEDVEEQLAKHNEDEKRKHEMLKRIDPEVDLVANDLFDMSLNEIKLTLSERVKNKETIMQKQLHDDLVAHEEAFKKKYNDLENQFHKTYEDRVKHQLKTEVHSKFRKMVQEKIDRTKVKLSREELTDLKEKAGKEYDIARETLKKKLANQLEEIKDRMRRHMEEELLMHKHQIHNEFEKHAATEVRTLTEQYKHKKDEELHRMLQDRTEAMRLKLTAEYEKRLEEEIKRRAEEMEKKKMAFEKDVKEKAQALFG